MSAVSVELAAAPCDPRLQAQVAASIAAHGVTPRFLPSGAGHDAMEFAPIAPVADRPAPAEQRRYLMAEQVPYGIPMVQADLRMGPLFKATLPFLLAVLVVMVLIAAVPALSTWLPAVTAR